MTGDPFYDAIVDGLGQHLDPELFEHCVNDLLRAKWPGLAPVPGGNDAGMDGAVADGEGCAFPLVTTTADAPIRNLASSLRSYLKSGGESRRVIFATSQKLTPQRRRNLEKKADELGFALLQVYERTGIANLLYYEPRWCKSLLGLSGDPTPLSIVPRSTRPYVECAPVGREADLAWLKAVDGDRLLVGQPGSGKTFLLRLLARAGRALFVVSSSRSEIAAAIRRQRATVLIVDDAHVAEELMANLLQLRTATEAQFAIVATCWPGERAALQAMLGLPGGQVRELSPMPRVQVAEVVRTIAPELADWVVGEIVTQAEGRPGLAATLAHFCRIGDFERVLKGEALTDSVRRSLKPIVGDSAIDCLACFALGGDSGYTLDAVADYLGKPPVDLRMEIVRLAAAGVIVERLEGALSVRPPALRAVLVRDVFFGAPARLDCERLIPNALNRSDVCKTLVAAACIGAADAHELIRGLLTRSPHCLAWAEYAWVNPECASWVLRNHNGALSYLAPPLLRYLPKEVMPLLLQEAVGDSRTPHANLDHPLRKLTDWVHGALPGTKDATARRRALASAARRWLESGRDVRVGTKALAAAFSIVFEACESDPVEDGKYTVKCAFLDENDLKEVLALWPDMASALGRIRIDDWRPLFEMLHPWARPHTMFGAGPSKEVQKVIRDGAAKMLRDLAELGGDRPGVVAKLSATARSLNLELEMHADPEFDVLFPRTDWRGDYRAQQQEQAEAAQALAARWALENPNTVARRLRRYEQEAQASDYAGPGRCFEVCDHIAAQTANASAWYAALRDAGCSAPPLTPFLRRMARNDVRGWEAAVSDALIDPALRAVAVEAVLTAPAAPSAVVDEALARLDGLARLVESLCWQGVVPDAVMVRLLQHTDTQIAAAAAIGEWFTDPVGRVREMLKPAWRRAIITSDGESHELLQILPTDPTLAFEWLQHWVEREPAEVWRFDDTAEAAATALTVDGRGLLLSRLSADKATGRLVQLLVGLDPALYRQVLGTPELARYHLAPLEGHPNPQWTALALEALRSGREPDEIVSASIGTSWSWSGRESDMWQGWINAFESLRDHSDEGIQAIARNGAERLCRKRDAALGRERDQAVRGR